MTVIQFPASDIILVGVIIFVILISICLQAFTLSRALLNKKVNERTYDMVHRFLGSQLRITSLSLRRVADITQDQDDICMAKEAEKAYREHTERS